MNLPKLVIQEHETLSRCKVNVVRGDLYTGGIKCRVLSDMFTEIKEEEIVYSGCYYGHSGFALGMAGLLTRKQIKLFLPYPVQSTYIHRQMLSLNNVECHFVDANHQADTIVAARVYAEKRGARLLPIGFDCPEFTDRLIALARSLPVNPREVWVSV